MESLAREILDMESNLEKEGQWILSSSCNVNSDVTCKKKALLPHHCLFHNLEMFVHQGRLPLTFFALFEKSKGTLCSPQPREPWSRFSYKYRCNLATRWAIEANALGNMKLCVNLTDRKLDCDSLFWLSLRSSSRFHSIVCEHICFFFAKVVW